MALVVVFGWFFVPIEATGITAGGLAPLLWLGIITAASRLTLFLGVKHLGSLQTALLGMLEVIVTIAVAFVLLGEVLTPIQWVGAGIILVSVALVRYEHNVPKVIDWWAMIYLRWNQRSV
jgi:drug/metabolite transporter (DMT)-like permease